GSGINVFLQTPSGDDLFNQNASNDMEGIILPEAGAYRLLLYGNSSSTGSYAFTLRDAALSVTPLVLGSNVTGTIAGPGDRAAYSFNGAAGERLFYNATAAAGSGINVFLQTPSGDDLFN